VIPLGLLLGLAAGLALGGKIGRLIDVRLHWMGLVFLALAARVATQVALAEGNELAEALRLPLFVGSFGLLAGALWLNRSHPGILAVAIGVASNGIAIVVNGGWMPVWEPALAAVGIGEAELNTSFHRPLPDELGLEFLLRNGPLGDVIPIPLPYLANVASVGDVFIAAGLGWFVFATLVAEDQPEEVGIALGPGRRTTMPIASIDRPVVLGSGRGPGLSAPEPLARGAPSAARLPLGARVRGHPYVRLALDARFVSFWVAQTISLFGDRLHQVALGVLVLAITDSPLLTGLVFLAATLPNIFLGPIAGTFVDRWDHKRVLIVSDVLRAGLVLLLPLAAAVDVILVYPIAFLVTTVSLFFRPAKVAVIPRIVKQDDLLAANSATWTAETLADIAGFPLAGLFVWYVGTELAIPFWIDAATYVFSALLLAGISIAPLAREQVPRVRGAMATFFGELAEGWRFLRSRAPLFQNTVISAIAQVSVGVTLALTIVYARDTLSGQALPYPQNYAAIETAVGIGNLVGGVAVGAFGARVRKGWLVVGGFIAMGLATMILGLSGHVLLAVIAAGVTGVANLIYIIPTQTLFIEMTPIEMMGRVVAFRTSLVFGSMTTAMAVAGILAESVPAGLVIALSGAVTLVAGLIAALLPAVRDA
jgi:MFS family permease